MNYLRDVETIEIEDAVSLLTSLSLKQLQERLLWIKANFWLEDRAHGHINILIKDMYRVGYVLVHGQWAMRRDIGISEEPQPAYLWVRSDDHEDDIWGDGLSLHVAEELVPASDPVPLISQALALTRAYRHGHKARSREVQASLCNLMGVDPTELTSSDD